MKPIIEIKNLSAGYDGRTVLHDVNLNVYERDFLGIIGPNGGGKTTLIKCILGLLKPTGGEIILHIPATKGSDIQPSLGYLPQYSTIDKKFPISVEEVIRHGITFAESIETPSASTRKTTSYSIVSGSFARQFPPKAKLPRL